PGDQEARVQADLRNRTRGRVRRRASVSPAVEGQRRIRVLAAAAAASRPQGDERGDCDDPGRESEGPRIHVCSSRTIGPQPRKTGKVKGNGKRAAEPRLERNVVVGRGRTAA